jgi:hypothetical protein
MWVSVGWCWSQSLRCCSRAAVSLSDWWWQGLHEEAVDGRNRMAAMVPEQAALGPCALIEWATPRCALLRSAVVCLMRWAAAY